MKHLLTATLLAATALIPAALAQEPEPKEIGALDVSVSGVKPGGLIPQRYAYCRIDNRGESSPSDNISPQITWKGAPDNTKSFVIIVVDKDVPADFSNANKHGVDIEVDAPRRDFYHWTAVDIPPTLSQIPEGKGGRGTAPKNMGKTEYGITGKNDFTAPGKFPQGGYDGPCPPWNDKRMHNYHFQVFAVDVPSLKPPSLGDFNGKALESVMANHIIAKGEVVGTYSTNGAVLGGE